MNKLKCYSTWKNMKTRCYNKNYHLTRPSYTECEMSEEWLDYKSFEKWYETNYIEGFVLDKDLLIKGNKIYSPETCCFIPQKINQLFVKRNSLRGNYPIGVHFLKGKYVARLNKDQKLLHLGVFNTPEEAFLSYKESKELLIKEIAEEYKEQISENVYKSMYNYTVDITD